MSERVPGKTYRIPTRPKATAEEVIVRALLKKPMNMLRASGAEATAQVIIDTLAAEGYAVVPKSDVVEIL